MPSNVSYPRKYYSTTYAELETIPLKEGNVISLYDTDGFYYDVGNPAGSGQNVIRRKANGIEFVGSLTDARQEPTTIFLIQNPNMLDEDGNSIVSYSGYRWNEDETPARFDEVFNNLRDFQVKTIASSSTKAYIVGSQDNDTTVGTLYKNPNIYLTANGNKIHAGLEGNADTATEANHAAQATLADKAINDNFSTPQPITSYLRGITSDATTDLGTTLTLTKGDGTTSTIRVSNTTYDVFTADPAVPGLVNGINTTVGSDSTHLLLTGSGWVDIDNIPMTTAESAEKDGEGQNIADTYIKELSYNTSTELLTVTWGDGDTDTISIPDTTYSVFDSSTDGLVPAPSGAGEGTYFLRGDHTWQPVVTADYVGATGVSAGVHGLVPAASSGDTDSYLRSDGTWAGTFSEDNSGLVPGPSSSDIGKSLKVATDGTNIYGTWEFCTDTKNTAGATNDVSNKLFLVGAASQGTEPQTYSNQYIFIDSNKLYSYSVTDSGAAEVVTLSDTQALTNKTYNGYTLGSACAGTLASTINGSTSNTAETFTGDGSTTTFPLTTTAITVTNLTVDGIIESNFTLQSNSIVFTTAPANNAVIAVAYTITNPNYNPDDVPKNSAVTSYVAAQINSVINTLSSKVDASVIGPEYDDTSTSYASGDFCMYNDGNGAKLYKCTLSISAPAGDFDPSKWTVTSIIDVIKSL